MEEEKVSQENTNSKAKTNWKSEILDLAKTFVICLAIVFVVTNFIVKPVQVEGDSMYPTLNSHAMGFVNLLLMKVDDVHRQDVVVVYNEEEKENWVKRVIGLPGDKVYAKDDVVYVNGEPLEEPYLDTDYVKETKAEHGYFTSDFEEITLGEDEYWLMGDNRIVSRDSRSVGPFKKHELVGKDVYVFYPFDQMGIIRNGSK